MEDALRDLELYKRLYFENNPESTKEEEITAVKKKAAELIQTVLPTTVWGNSSRAYDTNQKARLLLEAAKLYNILEDYNETAEKFLSKSVRMNPKNAEAWHELGKCVMKKKDVEFAQACFRVALVLDRSPQNLTCLAVGLRLMAAVLSDATQADLRTRAMDLITEAKEIDITYGPAHLAFATGLFFRFFNSLNSDLKLLEKAVENYRKAAGCEQTKTDPQVYLNMATCLKFMEKYEEALEAYAKGIEYDSRNEFGTATKLEFCKNYLIKFAEGIQKKGKVKQKKMLEFMSELNKLPAVPLDAFRVKIIGFLSHDEDIPLALIGADATGDVHGITVYNCLASFGFVIGDTITIYRPDYRSVENLKFPGVSTTVSMKWVRVNTPTQIKKNGVFLPESVLARAIASTQTK